MSVFYHKTQFTSEQLACAIVGVTDWKEKRDEVRLWEEEIDLAFPPAIRQKQVLGYMGEYTKEWKEYPAISREQALAFCEQHGIRPPLLFPDDPPALPKLRPFQAEDVRYFSSRLYWSEQVACYLVQGLVRIDASGHYCYDDFPVVWTWPLFDAGTVQPPEANYIDLFSELSFPIEPLVFVEYCERRNIPLPSELVIKVKEIAGVVALSKPAVAVPTVACPTPADTLQFKESDLLVTIFRLMLLVKDLDKELNQAAKYSRRRYERGSGISRNAVWEDIAEILNRLGLSTAGLGGSKTRDIFAAACRLGATAFKE